MFRCRALKVTAPASGIHSMTPSEISVYSHPLDSCSRLLISLFRLSNVMLELE